MERFVTLVVLLVAGALLVQAADEDTQADSTPDVDKTNTVVSTPSDITVPGQFLTLLANGGAVAAGVLAVAAIALLIMPVFGLRTCSLFGTCEPPTLYQQGYSAAPNSVYGDYPYGQTGTYNNPQYQKRSLEYVGPILKALSNAYEKYNRRTTTSTTTTNKP